MAGSTAKYEILIPKVDNQGNPLIDLGKLAHDHLFQKLKIHGAHIDTGRRVFWQGKEEPFDALVFMAQDSPKSDSHAKQVATNIAKLANQAVVLVTKHGKQGITPWPMKNVHHDPYAGADPRALHPGTTESGPKSALF